MENFTLHNPTKVIFGKGVVGKLGKEAVKYGNKALLVIGKGSVKSNGILDTVVSQLDAMGIQSLLFEGIKANPVYEDCDRAVAQAQDFQAEMIIAVGGGSVIDSAKGIAMGFYAQHSVWDFYSGKAPKPSLSLPILTVLTLSATGSEMNQWTVLQNDHSGEKLGYGHHTLFPKVSFLDPTYTFTVPPHQTAYGIADLMSHCLEAYFDTSDSPLSDRMVCDMLALAMKYGRQVIAEPQNYDARANIMWLATTALNGWLDAGKRGGDWGVHGFEHSLSVLYDIAHGAGLSIVYPAWLKHFKTQNQAKLEFLANGVLGQGKSAADFIQSLEEFFTTIGTPTRLSSVGINQGEFPKILENLKKNKVSGAFFKMNESDYSSLLEKML
jgi:alcohol dehydrogenase YqhD (iron-dependent ADH family)